MVFGNGRFSSICVVGRFVLLVDLFFVWFVCLRAVGLFLGLTTLTPNAL